MSGLLIITIITLAVISCLIIGLTIFSYWTILKSASRLAKTGALDSEITKEINENRSKSKKIINTVSQAASLVVCLALVTIAVISGIYHVTGQKLVTNNHVSFVIASNSMEDYFDDDYKTSLIKAYADEYHIDEQSAEKKITSEQFEVGDFLQFDVLKEDEELHYFDVYGYKNKKGKIITHRFVGVAPDGSLLFRGDNTGGLDSKVNREQVLYHYQGHNTKYIGLVVLFFGSGFGIYAIMATIVIYVVSDVAIYKWEKIKADRLKELGLYIDKKKKRKK